MRLDKAPEAPATPDPAGGPTPVPPVPVPATPSVIEAQPVLRNLQKESTRFVPSAVMKKKAAAAAARPPAAAPSFQGALAAFKLEMQAMDAARAREDAVRE